MLPLFPQFVFGSRQLLLAEAALVLLITPVAFFRPRLADTWFCSLESRLGRLAARKKTCIALVGVSALLIRAVLSPLLPVRVPEVHDEFSYLLAAQTFRAARLTNPPHPLWMHFESFHILQQPTYMSMYPAAQGLVLALGMALGGGPWLGVGLSSALLCATICWMLQGWFPPAWALWGAALALMRFAVFNYWATTYWGGAMAAAGGALLLGALPRILRAPRPAHALLLGLGVATLANSRPYEGLVLSVPCALALLWWLLREGRWKDPRCIKAFVLPLLAVLTLSAALMAWSFWRVTGSPWVMPYSVNQATYSMTNPFFWQPLRPVPVYRHPVMRDYYRRWELASYARLTTYSSRVNEIAAKMRDLWEFFLGPALTLPFLMLPWAWKDRRPRLLAIPCIAVLAGLAPVFWMTFPHYAAPLTAAAFGLLVQCARHLQKVRLPGVTETAGSRATPAGRFLVRAVPLLCLATLLLRAAAPAFFRIEYASHSWCCAGPGNVARDRVRRELQAGTARNLVIVRYGPGHRVSDEWVYNDADIDASPVVWAREMTPEEDLRLVSFFRSRTVWLAEPDLSPPRITRWQPTRRALPVPTGPHTSDRSSGEQPSPAHFIPTRGIK